MEYVIYDYLHTFINEKEIRFLIHHYMKFLNVLTLEMIIMMFENIWKNWIILKANIENFRTIIRIKTVDDISLLFYKKASCLSKIYHIYSWMTLNGNRRVLTLCTLCPSICFSAIPTRSSSWIYFRLMHSKSLS